ncbi:cysteine dioxygenase family protein [Thalassobaculum salexigens]|uniref:cysteine dioxygenase family protein n=1 Tax=Thalassobaculum salexigens TaxID=455360 RepID=UPI00146C186E|nr:cysteine dioxygenase family protein [Thalassobaculum salexigens]
MAETANGVHAMIETLVADIRRILREEPAGDAMLTALVERLAPLAADTSWIDEDLYETDAAQGFGISILHEEPGDGFLLETVCWEPGRGVAPHDHQTWGVVMGLTGEEINVDWRRTDDGSAPGKAALEQAGETVVTGGVVKTFRPDDIHSIRNASQRPSLSLHLYGRSLAKTDRSEFNPLSGTVVPCPKRVRRAG